MVAILANTNDNIEYFHKRDSVFKHRFKGRMMEVKVHQYLDGPIDQGDKWSLICMVEKRYGL